MYTLFGSEGLFLIGLLVCFLYIFLLEVMEETEPLVFIAIVALVVNQFWGTFPVWEYLLKWKMIVVYLLVGVLFSVIRTYFKGKSLTEKQLKNYDLRKDIIRWWLIWPISLVVWIIKGSFLKFLENIADWAEETFYKIMNFRKYFTAAFGKIEKIYTSILNLEKKNHQPD